MRLGEVQCIVCHQLHVNLKLQKLYNVKTDIPNRKAWS